MEGGDESTELWRPDPLRAMNFHSLPSFSNSGQYNQCRYTPVIALESYLVNDTW